MPLINYNFDEFINREVRIYEHKQWQQQKKNLKKKIKSLKKYLY